ncbi:MAG: hypothetical protein ABI633_14760, partial [Burkholderiales bacterium]
LTQSGEFGMATVGITPVERTLMRDPQDRTSGIREGAEPRDPFFSVDISEQRFDLKWTSG